MTVGIAALCEDGGDPMAIVAGDRMVSFTEQGGIEYEDTSSKIFPVEESSSVTAVCIGSGYSTMIDEVQRRLNSILENPDNTPPTNIEECKNALLAAYKQTVRSKIRNQVLSPFNYQYSDLRDPDIEIPSEIQQYIARQIHNIRENSEVLRFLIAGVGLDGGGIYEVSGMDYTNFSDMGYAVIGSGTRSARLTFIRREYDRYRSYQEGVFTVLESKKQAEERQGVGKQTDLYCVTQNSITELDTASEGDLVQKLSKIEARERQAREKIMDEWREDSG